MNFIDLASIKLCGITIFGGILLNILPSGTLGFLTGLAALTTILYNAIKAYKEFKNK